MEIRKLEIRRLKEEELGSALKLVWEVFEKEIKPSYTEEGVQEFLGFIDYNFMKDLFDRGELIFWGAFEEELIGTVAVRKDGHISLFFVKNEYQGLGIGKALFQMIYNYCVEELKVKKLTVNAAPQSVTKYIHMGMRQIGNMEEKNGIRSVPMEMYASPTLVKPVEFRKKKNVKSSKKVWIAIVAAIILVIGGVIFAGVNLFRNIVKFDVKTESTWEEPSDEIWEQDEDAEDSADIPGELSGVEAIESYEAEELPYEIVNEGYNFVDNEKINTVIDFSVQYAKLQSDKMDEQVLAKVNQVIYDCAMETVEEIYNNPTEEIKEAVLNADTPALVSYVTYKVTYASENLISIVMEDHSYRGNQEEYYYDFRTLNISLKDGTVYEVKDIVNLDDDFVKDWLMTMRSEAESNDLLSELNKKELIKALEGESFDGVYEVEYFFDKDGIEIGFAFNYEEDDENNAGYAWVTAPFSYKEIEKFTTDSAIWDEMN